MKRIAVIGTGFRKAGTATPPQEILNLKAAGFDPFLIETRLPSFPMNEINRVLSETANIETGLRAVREEGADAIFINTVGDYGLHALRSALRVPVIGAGEATMNAAAQLGQRFSIVTIWPRSMNFIYTGLLRLYRMKERFVSVRFVSANDELATLSKDKNFITDMRSGEVTQQDRIVAMCNRAIEEDGADTIMLGCTCMSPIAADIAARVKVPVLNALTTGYKATEMALSLNHVHSVEAYRPVGGTRDEHYTAIAKAVTALDVADPRGKAQAAE